MFMDREFTFDRVIRIGIGLAAAGGLLFLLGLLQDVLTPFAIAVLLAYMMNPLVDRLQRRLRRRGAAVLAGLLLVTAAASAALLVLIPLVVQELSALGGLLRQAARLDLPAWVDRWLPEETWRALVQRASDPDFLEVFTPERLWQIAETGLQKALPGAWRLLSGAAGFLLGLTGLVVVAFYLVFLLIDYDRFQAGWPELIPEDYREPVLDFLREFSDAMRRYFRGQAAIAAIVGVLFAIGFWLIGLPLGILLGLFIGLLNMVPYLQIVGAVPAFLLAALGALASGGNVWAALGLCGLVFVVVQTFQDLVLTPRILGRALGLSPVAILLALSIWGRLLGLLGLLIALPATCLLLAAYRRHWVPSRKSKAAPPPPASGQKNGASDGI
jgi:predicted PurR-regulated permease PerM